MYPRVPVQTGYAGPTPEIDVSEIRRVLSEVNAQAGCGLPLAVQFNNKGAAFEAMYEDIVAAVYARVWVLCTTEPSELRKLTPEQLVEKGYAELVRLFVKNELHPQAKLDEGRYRLICSVDMVTSAATQVVMGKQMKHEIANAEICPSGPGLDLTKDESCISLWNRVMPSTSGWRNVVSSDAKGWDFGVSEELMFEKAELVIALADAAEDSAYAKYVRNSATIASRSVYATSDGRMFVLKGNGVVLTGDADTSAGNSWMRNLLAIYSGCDNTISMGDDNICDHPDPETMVKKFREYGVRLTDVVSCREKGEFEFCSAYFTATGARPVNLVKGLKNLLNAKHSEELLVQFREQYRHSPDLAWAETVLTASGWMQ